VLWRRDVFNDTVVSDLAMRRANHHSVRGRQATVKIVSARAHHPVAFIHAYLFLPTSQTMNEIIIVYV
jgi:hypothetical protein